MSTALVIYTPMEQVELSKGVWEFAQAIAPTDFVPKALRGNAGGVLACMMKGAEVGLPLMQSLASIHVIEGRPTMSAESMRAIVLSRGHEIWIEESSSTRCVMVGQRLGTERPQKFTWTLDDARAAGLIGKDVWKKFPSAMLIARCTGVLCRTVFPDCLAGISYTKEELEDGSAMFVDDVVDTTATDAPGPAAVEPKRATAKARQAATRGAAATTPDAPVEQRPTSARGERPPLPGEEDIVDAEVVDDAPVDEHAGPRMSGPQMIGMLMGQHGVKERADKQRAVEMITGRQVESTKDLTPEETAAVITFLNGLSENEDFPFDADSAGGTVPAPVTLPDAKAADAVPAPPSPQQSDADGWREPEWREYLGSKGVRLTEFWKFARPLVKERSGQSVGNADELAGLGLGDELRAWIDAAAEGQS